MQLSIPFTELTALIRKETGQSVGLAYKAQDELNVSYLASVNVPLIGPINKEIQAGVKLLDVSNDRVVLRLDVGMLSGVLGMTTSYLKNRLPTGLVESVSNGELTLRLSAIPQLQSVFDRLEVEGVELAPDSLILRTHMK